MNLQLTQVQLTQLLMEAFLWLLLASVASSSVYFPLRLLQSRSQFWVSVVIAIPITIFLALTAYKILPPKFILFGSVIAFIGSFFHRKSSDLKLTFRSSFLLMLVVASFDFLFIIILFSVFIIRFRTSLPEIFSDLADADWRVFPIVMSQAIVVPFLIWVWKSFRLRPGIDKHFDE